MCSIPATLWDTPSRRADAGWIGEAGWTVGSTPDPAVQENDFTANRNTTFMTFNLSIAQMLRVAAASRLLHQRNLAGTPAALPDLANPDYR